jgi:hypothetical protein
MMSFATNPCCDLDDYSMSSVVRLVARVRSRGVHTPMRMAIS